MINGIFSCKVQFCSLGCLLFIETIHSYSGRVRHSPAACKVHRALQGYITSIAVEWSSDDHWHQYITSWIHVCSSALTLAGYVHVSGIMFCQNVIYFVFWCLGDVRLLLINFIIDCFDLIWFEGVHWQYILVNFIIESSWKIKVYVSIFTIFLLY